MMYAGDEFYGDECTSGLTWADRIEDRGINCDACSDTGCPACCDEQELQRLGLAPAQPRTWRGDLPTNRCRHCREQFRVSQEALAEARESGATGTDAEIADSLDTCLSCSCEEEAPGEKVYGRAADCPPEHPAVVVMVYSAAQMEKAGGRGAMTLRLCASHAEDADPPAAQLSAEPGTPCDFCPKEGAR